ncbi:class II fructose-bisphosphatase [Lysinibacillus sp. FSL K6-0057]|uniref:class II fructose-bisphosphatase n=1 Tax=unclassified Lysinibacillus TaxID=2636778 RepID=UPI002175E1A9|nr:class II fructose-bisphosphatase [Lysinibacillus sp. A4]MCS5500472.1 class II fructose-bisphosphatase [Lysinibacillus sp. A4]
MTVQIKHFANDFMKVTQMAALNAYPWIGRGNKIAADGAGTNAMRNELNQLPLDITVVIGEGEMDEAPMLYIGEKLGTGEALHVDIAVDPIEGTTLVAKGMNDAMAVMAVAPQGTLLHAPDMYMKKMACGPQAKGAICLTDSLKENMHRVAKALHKPVRALTVMIQDRPRHQQWIEDVLEEGAKVKLFAEVDITGVLATSLEQCDVDLFIGIGGAPEGVIAAAAQKGFGGDFLGQLMPETEEEYARCVKMGIKDPHQIWTLDELVQTDDCLFTATGVTDGFILKGVMQQQAIMHSYSLVVAPNHRQFVEAKHEENEILVTAN